MCCNPERFSSIGLGFTLYFLLKKYIIYAYILLIALISAPAITLLCIKFKDRFNGLYQIINTLSISNLYDYKINPANNDEYPLEGNIVLILNFVAILFFLSLSALFRNKLDKIFHGLDQKFYTAGDFAVLCKNLPTDATKEEIQVIIDKMLSEDKDKWARVVYVNYIYDIEDYIKVTQKMNTN